MLKHHATISAYLTIPRTHRNARTAWQGFRTEFIEVKRHNPQFASRTLAALIIWTLIIGSFQSLTYHTPQATHKPTSAASSLAAALSTPPQATPSVVAESVHANKILPGGPSGLLLPPGTMAPDNTYPRNTYLKGQCTWYVAGRRQIPPGWGNANRWYYHAISAKWDVGTTPAIAAIAWTSQGWAGHVALVEQISPDGKQVYISEMNYIRAGYKSFRWAAVSDFKYIY